jgi:hypothetical protein
VNKITGHAQATRSLQSAMASRRPVLIAIIAVFLIGALGIGRSVGLASQEDTPTAGHPLVGTWIVDPEDNDPTNPPSFDSFMADGTLVNVGSDGASVGSWVATGPNTATMTFTGLVADGTNATAFIIRGSIEVDESGDQFTATHSFTLIGADGSVIMSAQGGGGHGVRLQAEAPDQAGNSLPGYLTWTPAAPETSTPTS